MGQIRRSVLFEDNAYGLAKGNRVGERLAEVAAAKGILLTGRDRCCYQREIDEKRVDGPAVGCFPDLYEALSGNPPDQGITL